MDEITKEYRSRMKKKLAWMEYTLLRIKEIEDQKQGDTQVISNNFQTYLQRVIQNMN